MAKFENSKKANAELVKYRKRSARRAARKCKFASKEAVAEMVWRSR